MTEPFPEPVIETPPDANPFPPYGTRADIPDHTVNEDNGPVFAPPPSDDGKRGRRPRLGEGRQRASGVRKLNKADLDTLGGYYTTMGIMLMPFRPAAGQACVENADGCVEAWRELAEQNDKVRKALLAVIEGGAWGKVIGAHVPLIWALLPSDTGERLGNMISLSRQEPTEDSEMVG